MKSLAILVFLTVATASHAAGFYLKGTALFDKPQDLKVSTLSSFRASLDENIGMSGAVGYKLGFGRAEFEIQSLRNNFETAQDSSGFGTTSGSVKRFTGFGNIYLDLPSFFGFGPYVGAGLGFAKVDVNNVAIISAVPTVSFSGRDTAFAYQVAVGAEFHVLGWATIHAGYRWVNHEDITLKDTVSAARHSIQLGQNRMFEVGLAIGF